MLATHRHKDPPAVKARLAAEGTPAQARVAVLQEECMHRVAAPHSAT
jgi:hypothetical protein